ncbi:MAG: hypothetical protein RIE87_04790 [Rhodospirillales bacterium]|tara:strand:+ start:3023 stop:3331 length:309 start_codon:yes stop_codon:yes gene_type:complete
MIGSAQKAPGVSAALTALNLAVVRQVVFERAAEQISDRREDATAAVVQTAEENRNRNAAVEVVLEDKNSSRSAADDKSSAADSEFKSPDFSANNGKTVDIQV